MSVVAVQFLGRFGNCMFSYAFARAYAEKYGHEFQCDSWDGQRIFQLNDKPITAEGLTNRNENDIIQGEGDIVIRSYCQQQKCLIYTAGQVRKWFKFQEWVDKALCDQALNYAALAHHRKGDYAGYNYPCISEKSYRDKFAELEINRYEILSEENPLTNPAVPQELSFLTDFYCMTQCDVLLRGNSTFSWWAATLNRHGKIYSPVMTGCEGGKESDVLFIEGNYPSFNPMLSFVTDLHLQP